MRQTKFKLRKFALLGAAVLLGLCLLAVLESRAGQQEESRWTGPSHDRTNFPLVGRHLTVSCRECHLKGTFEGTPTACEACHWVRRQDDRYRLQLGLHCGDCHVPQSWKNVPPSKWDHAAVTGFKLEGAHRVQDCAECHGNEGLRKTSVECYSCHENNYRSAKEPDHLAARFPTQCQVCHHSMMRWEGAVFDHKFELLGKHKLAACTDCHTTGQYAGLPSACVSCHLANYNGTTDPNHQQAGYSTDCVTCHGDGASSWDNANVNHAQFWPLQGRHQSLACSACHSKGYVLPRDCYGCHATDYNNAANPNHKAAGFPTTCDTCHYPTHTAWTQAVFGHDFPIKSGKHVGFVCADCHTTNNFQQFSCIDCHTHSKSTVDSAHRDVGGYSYNSQSCYACHPKGQAGG